MTYGHRSTLRKECSKFLRFAYLVDFLAMESLSGVYLGTAKDILARLNELDELDNHGLTSHDFMNRKGTEPLLKLNVMFKPNMN